MSGGLPFWQLAISRFGGSQFAELILSHIPHPRIFDTRPAFSPPLLSEVLCLYK